MKVDGFMWILFGAVGGVFCIALFPWFEFGILLFIGCWWLFSVAGVRRIRG